MLRSLNSAVTGLTQFQNKIDAIGNNIANSNTTAFKAGRVDFQSALSQSLDGELGSGTQIGSGVATAAVKNLFGQGSLAFTGVQTDLAVSGEGFFMVRDTQTDLQYATRAGDFRLDASGYLVTNAGLRLQGFSDSGLATRGDLRIDGDGRPEGASPDATVVAFNIDSEGRINVRLSDGTEFMRGQVLLQRFQDPQALHQGGGNLFSGIAAAGPLGGASPQSEPAGTYGLGRIQSGTLELSNVDLAGEFSNLIAAQRGFQANARMITTSDEMMQELVNLKR
jgi:flagellar hook protein FlgE